ncbi:unnamed protein product [Cercopithifilaria johnstoni]|uniref:Uncharacterized protein n=1 Tax=Cercopithifilaria johnstoni TaxID=2874296 RepID=A0A8J2Q8G5_9BILA|nr:unnamed protein product [Cercopithifilaria johnstoni]
MNASNICQSHLDLNAQNGITSYDINSLVDDDFEVIGSLSDTMRSVSLETSSEIPLYNIEIGNRYTIAENPTSATAVTNKKIDEGTALANNSLNLLLSNAGRNTNILTQIIIKSSSIDSTDLSVHLFHEDPINTVELIRADYQAAQQAAKQENELLRKACEKKNEQIIIFLFRLKCCAVDWMKKLRRRFNSVQNWKRFSAILMNAGKIKVDEEIAGKIEREDIIRVLQTTIVQLQSSGDLSCLGSSVVNEQALVSSLHEKEELIEALKKQLEGAEERYEKEHKEVLDLEEIVKILHEYLQNDQQTQVE